jgi:hypothetical protein
LDKGKGVGGQDLEEAGGERMGRRGRDPSHGGVCFAIGANRPCLMDRTRGKRKAVVTRASRSRA